MAEASQEGAWEPEATEPRAAKDAPRLSSLALVDLAAVLAGLSIWAAADMWQLTTGYPLATVVAVGNGIFVGYFATALVHEWGHYLGARWSRAKTTLLRRRGISFARFRYDFEHSTTAQFRAMSIGGNLGHWLMVAMLVVSLPLVSLGQMALVAAAFAFAVFGSFIEFPVIARISDDEAPEVTLRARVTKKTFQQAHWLSAAGGLVLFAALI